MHIGRLFILKGDLKLIPTETVRSRFLAFKPNLFISTIRMLDQRVITKQAAVVSPEHDLKFGSFWKLTWTIGISAS